MFLTFRRIVAAITFFLGIAIYGITVDAAIVPLQETVMDMGVADGPFAAPIEAIPQIAYLTVAIFFISVAAWMLFAPIMQTRIDREEEIRLQQ